MIFILSVDDVVLSLHTTRKRAMLAAYDSLWCDIFDSEGATPAQKAALTRAMNRDDWPAMQKVVEEAIGWEYKISHGVPDDGCCSEVVE